jgi:Fe-S cluster assembly protein SufD
MLESFACVSAEGAASSPYFTNSVTEMALDENADVTYCRLQCESETAFHIGTTQVELAAGARMDSHVVSSGGKLSRHELNVVLRGEGSACNLKGLAIAHGWQLVDHQTHIDHVKPRCLSRETYKAVIDDDAHGVFSGKIHVHPNAQKTDARQTNHTLLLSDNAVMDTQPQLEIYADDVKCTHGASVGSLDEQAMFYLRSRGIDAEDARRLLTFAFMNEILQLIPTAAVRQHLEQHLFDVVQFESDQS